MSRTGWIAIIFLLTLPAAAQDTCEPGSAQALLDANEVRARILNHGGLFWSGSPHVYEVPAHSGRHAIYAAGFWVGGMVDGEMRLAAARYGPWEMFPGPMGTTGQNCQKHDRIYEITKDDLDEWISDGYMSDNLEEWPWELGAPVTDGDGNPDNYDLEAGDLPELLGEQTLWWVMNDAGGPHGSTNAPPVNVEIRTTAFATDLGAPVSHTTFYRYEMTYRGNAPLREAYVSMFIDPDLGNFQDDFVGSDTTLGMGFVYNADDDDEGDEGYGKAPPALGVVVLDAPAIWRKVRTENGAIDPRRSNYMTSFMYFLNGGGYTQGDPSFSNSYYNYMQGRWGTGEQMTIGGTGLGFSNEVTTFAFPGDPQTRTFWSEENSDGTGMYGPSDRRMVLSNGPFELEPGESTTFTVAFVWSRGADRLDSVGRLKKDAEIVKYAAPALLQPIWRPPPERIDPKPVHRLGANEIYPNPASETATFPISLNRPMHVRLEVFDVLGRRVHDGVDEIRGAGRYDEQIPVTDWPPGTYLVRLRLDHHAETTKTLIVAR